MEEAEEEEVTDKTEEEEGILAIVISDLCSIL